MIPIAYAWAMAYHAQMAYWQGIADMHKSATAFVIK